MYQASIPVFLRNLANLSAILDKAAAHAEENKLDAAIFTTGRLIPNMLPLTAQVQIMSDSAKGCGARLAGVDIPSYPDTETTFVDLQARIAKTVAFLQGLTAAQIDGSETRTINLKVGGNELSFSGQHFLLNFAMPNFYFHYTTAYDILRHLGVKLGKMDFLGGI
jgi:hypothetical protein